MAVPQGRKINIDYDKKYTVVLQNGLVCSVDKKKTEIILDGRLYCVRFTQSGNIDTLSIGAPGGDRDYCISEILSNPLPELPKGYKWAGGWPTLKVLKNNELFLSNYPEYEGSYGADRNHNNVMEGFKRIVLEKIEADIPKESPEDYVDITDLYPEMHARIGIDESAMENGGSRWRWTVETLEHKKIPYNYTIGEWYKQRQIRHRCKRKDLPVATPNDKYPVYYVYHINNKIYAKFIIRTSVDTCSPIWHDGKPYRGIRSESWGPGEESAVKRGEYILSSKEEYNKFVASLNEIPPVQNDTPKEYPVYYSISPYFGNKFVVKTSDTKCHVVSLKGEKGEEYAWSKADQREVDNKNYTLSSKEEYSKFMASLDVYPVPRYYIHNNRNIGDGYLSYVKQTGNEFVQYSFLGGVNKREPKAMLDILRQIYTEVSEKEAIEFHNSEWPKPVYYSGHSTYDGFKYRYIIRTSTNKYTGVLNSGTTVSMEFDDYIRDKISSGVYVLTNESEVVSFIGACEEFDSIIDEGESSSPKVSKIKWATNYFITEPIVTASKAFAKSFRYVLLGAVVSGGAYAYTHPQQISRLLPKISIKVSAPPVIRG